MIDSRQDHIWKGIQAVLREKRYQTRLTLLEDLSFYVFRTDTNSVLARGIQGFEAAKSKANDLRKQNKLKWDQIQFKAERQTPTPKQFGVSKDGRTYTNDRGDTGRVDYARNYNPSKGRRFRGAYDKDGNYADID